MPATVGCRRAAELLPTPYVHVVFTLPRELAPLALQNKKVIYELLFHASAETLLEVALDPKHLGAPRSVSSAYCIPGIRSSNFTPMSIAYSQPVGCPPITRAGSQLAALFSFPTKC